MVSLGSIPSIIVILYVLRTWAINEVLIKMGVGGYADMGGMAEDFGSKHKINWGNLVSEIFNIEISRFT